MKEYVFRRAGLNCDLEHILETVRINETAKKQASSLLNNNEIKEEYDSVSAIRKRKCFSCGRSYPHSGRCPAADKQCNKCKKTGHFSKCCKANLAHVNHIKDTDPVADKEELDKDYFF